MIAKYGLRFVALFYLAALLLVPVAMIGYHTLENGISPVWTAINEPDAVKALVLSLKVALIAVPLNTAFGIVFALMIVRSRMRGKAFLEAALNIPFAVSPVVVGLTLILVYGQDGWFGQWFINHGHPVIFAVPGMVIATIFVSLPFVAREVIPVLREIGIDQEQAASTLGATSRQVFWRVTLPAIRWGVIYGVVLTTARAIGEYGAVAVVSGNVIGGTQTLPLRVESEYQNFDRVGAYSAGLELALIALFTLFAMNLIKPRKETTHGNRRV
jgi:sulfate transport system permease protein